MIWLCVYKKTVLVCEIFPSPEVVLCVLTLYGSGMSWRVVTQLHFESHSWRDHTMRCCLGLKCIWFMLERLSESGPNLLTQQNRPAVIGQYIKYWRKPSGMLALLTGIQTRCIVGDRSPDFLSLYLNKNHCRAWRAHIVYRQRLSSAMLILHLVYFSKIGTDWNVHQTWIPTHHCGAVGWTVVHEPRGRWFDSCFLRCSWTRRPDPVAAPSHMCNCFHMEINKICHLIFLVFLVIKHLLVPACGDTTRSLSLSLTLQWADFVASICSVFSTPVSVQMEPTETTLAHKLEAVWRSLRTGGDANGGNSDSQIICRSPRLNIPSSLRVSGLCLSQITITETVLFLVQYTSKEFDRSEKTVATGDCCYLNPLVRRTFRFLGKNQAYFQCGVTIHMILDATKFHWSIFVNGCAHKRL